jgi:hypothetical protein
MAPRQKLEITQLGQRVVVRNRAAAKLPRFANRCAQARITELIALCRAADIQYLPGGQEQHDLMHLQNTAPSQG